MSRQLYDGTSGTVEHEDERLGRARRLGQRTPLPPHVCHAHRHRVYDEAVAVRRTLKGGAIRRHERQGQKRLPVLEVVDDEGAAALIHARVQPAPVGRETRDLTRAPAPLKRE